ncbi:hypothetical protein L2E82_44863 [Cichorium intybus]|uniref:Uncharacterized protein n=1 Tax=Cichorium intybus TaxID=13427 RepID=A0ACB8ZRQ6_CICIN|nr:hypothetical protein L2E82_44863 [Cichorium intybus]
MRWRSLWFMSTSSPSSINKSCILFLSRFLQSFPGIDFSLCARNHVNHTDETQSYSFSTGMSSFQDNYVTMLDLSDDSSCVEVSPSVNMVWIPLELMVFLMVAPTWVDELWPGSTRAIKGLTLYGTWKAKDKTICGILKSMTTKNRPN